MVKPSDPQIHSRVIKEMRVVIKRKADFNARSINAEILYRLAKSLDQEESDWPNIAVTVLFMQRYEMKKSKLIIKCKRLIKKVKVRYRSYCDSCVGIPSL